LRGPGAETRRPVRSSPDLTGFRRAAGAAAEAAGACQEWQSVGVLSVQPHCSQEPHSVTVSRRKQRARSAMVARRPVSRVAWTPRGHRAERPASECSSGRERRSTRPSPGASPGLRATATARPARTRTATPPVYPHAAPAARTGSGGGRLRARRTLARDRRCRRQIVLRERSAVERVERTHGPSRKAKSRESRVDARTRNPRQSRDAQRLQSNGRRTRRECAPDRGKASL
jgi:hypothetical protein